MTQFTNYLIRNRVLSSHFEEFRAYHLSDDERLLLIRFFVYISDMLYLTDADVRYVAVRDLAIANSPTPHMIKFLVGSSAADRTSLSLFFSTLHSCLGVRHPLDEYRSPPLPLPLNPSLPHHRPQPSWSFSSHSRARVGWAGRGRV